MRKSELGNLVAANMADIMTSDEHRSLFHKQAETEVEEVEEDDASAVTAKFKGLIESVLKMSEEMDDLGMTKSASDMIKFADKLVHAAGADTIEELMRENPDLDVDLAVIKEEPAQEGEFDPRAMAVELQEEEEGIDPDDIVAQLEAIQRGEEGEELDPKIEAIEMLGKEGPDVGFESAAPEGGYKNLEIPGLEDIKSALQEVEAWLQKNGSEKSDEIKLDADLSTLLTTAEKEVEDYLIEKNLEL